MKPFVVPEMTLKGHSSLGHLDFQSETGNVGYAYFQTKLLKWPWRWVSVIGDGTVQQATYHLLLVVRSNHVPILYRFW